MKEKNAKFSGPQPENEPGHEVEVDINTDENMSGSTHLNDSIGDENELSKIREELQLQKEKYLRLFAEFDNFKKRSARERLELIQTAGREVIISLLDVLDDCDRAEKQLQNSNVMLVFNKLRAVLQSKGVRAMESINTDFDVEKHEAISEIPAPRPELKGKVIDEVTKGYYLNDKIIRFAKVIVGK